MLRLRRHLSTPPTRLSHTNTTLLPAMSTPIRHLVIAEPFG